MSALKCFTFNWSKRYSDILMKRHFDNTSYLCWLWDVQVQSCCWNDQELVECEHTVLTSMHVVYVSIVFSLIVIFQQGNIHQALNLTLDWLKMGKCMYKDFIFYQWFVLFYWIWGSGHIKIINIQQSSNSNFEQNFTVNSKAILKEWYIYIYNNNFGMISMTHLMIGDRTKEKEIE